MIRDKRIFLTGGAGFIATTIASKLCENNKIVLYDNLWRNTLQYTDLLSNDNVSFIKGDVLDFDLLRVSMEGADIVVHCAAIAGIDTVIKAPVNTMEVNIIGTYNVLKASVENKIKDRFINFSTSEVFGSKAYKVAEDAQTIAGSAGEARWSYAVSKLAGEHFTSSFYRYFALPTVVVRPFNIYGPGQTGEGAIQIFIQRALENEDICIYGDGTQIRAWCYIDDMVEGVILAMESPKAIGISFNIGNSRAVITVFGLAETVCRVLESRSRIVFKEPLSADIELRIPETRRALDILGFKAKVDLEEGIKRTAQWFREMHQSNKL